MYITSILEKVLPILAPRFQEVSGEAVWIKHNISGSAGPDLAFGQIPPEKYKGQNKEA